MFVFVIKYNIIILMIGIMLIVIVVNGGIVGKVIVMVFSIIKNIVFGVKMEYIMRNV